MHPHALSNSESLSAESCEHRPRPVWVLYVTGQTEAYQVAPGAHPHLLRGQRLELKTGSRASRGELRCNTDSCGSVDFCACDQVRKRKRRDILKKRVESHCATLNISALRAMIPSRIRALTPKSQLQSAPGQLQSASNNSAYPLRRTYAF